jgi:hypothetical protein
MRPTDAGLDIRGRSRPSTPPYIQERWRQCREDLVDKADMEPIGVIGWHDVGDLEQLPDRGIEIGERSFFFELHQARAASAAYMCPR